MKGQRISHVGISEQTGTLATGGFHNTLSLHNTSTLDETQEVELPYFTSEIAVHPGGTLIAVSTMNGAVYLLTAPEVSVTSLKNLLTLLITHQRCSLPQPSTPLPIECENDTRNARRDRPTSDDDELQLHPKRQRSAPKRVIPFPKLG